MKRKRGAADGVPPSPFPQRAHDWGHLRAERFAVTQDLEFRTTAAAAAADALPAPPALCLGVPAAPWEPLADAALRERVMSAKSNFDDVPRETLLRARDKANPYELIGRASFANRAALKMLELDSYAGLTCLPAVPGEDAFPFVDLCGGPGGWTEYVLWRFATRGDSRRCRGWGMTLREHPSQVVWHCGRFCAPARRAVDLGRFAFFGPTGDGDATKNANLRALADAVLAETDGRGAALLMADGGTDVDGNWNEQETLLRHLVLCEALAALLCVRVGGAFVCKVFDLFTELMTDVLYVLWSCFEEIALIKPCMSRPANSERFLICRGKRLPPGADTAWARLLLDANAALPTDPAAAVFDRRAFADDAAFTGWLRATNDALATRQLAALAEVMKHLEDEQGPGDYRQAVAQRFLEHHGLQAEPAAARPS